MIVKTSVSTRRSTLGKRLRVPAYILVILLGLYLFNKLLNFTLYNPAVAVPVYGWAEKHHLVEPYFSLRQALSGKPHEEYPLIPIAKLQSFADDLPRAAVIGTVTSEVHNLEDGDWHVNVRGRHGRTQVLEIVSDFPLRLPKLGERIYVWGIVRYDIGHRWWELHPVMGWRAEP